MVKIRLRRIGTKARPFYRVVVTPSTAARNGRFVETLGTYDPVRKPVQVKIDEERAMHWLMNGAQPTETAAHLLSRIGVLDRYFEQRPSAKKNYAFLDKRTDAMSVKSVIEPATPKKEPAPTPEPVAEATEVAEAPAENAAPAQEAADAAPETEAAAETSAPAAPEDAPQATDANEPAEASTEAEEKSE